MCRKGLSRTFQIPRPFPKMTVLENIMVASVFGTRNKKTTNPITQSRELLEFVEFSLPEDTISETLNTVQLKRIDLARALASDPKLLLLDELAAGLTEGELTDLMGVIHRIREKGVTIPRDDLFVAAAALHPVRRFPYADHAAYDRHNLQFHHAATLLGSPMAFLGIRRRRLFRVRQLGDITQDSPTRR